MYLTIYQGWEAQFGRWAIFRKTVKLWVSSSVLGKFCQKFKINQAKVTKLEAFNYFCLVNFKLLTEFEFKTE
jgi:hypothetical protein